MLWGCNVEGEARFEGSGAGALLPAVLLTRLLGESDPEPPCDVSDRELSPDKLNKERPDRSRRSLLMLRML